MKTFFDGIKYNFEIIYKEINESECYWTLRAICKESNHYSGINNLNPILSELGIHESTRCGRFEDSSNWSVSKREMKKFNNITNSFLTDKKYLIYLKNRLDEDRTRGEWENAEK